MKTTSNNNPQSKTRNQSRQQAPGQRPAGRPNGAPQAKTARPQGGARVYQKKAAGPRFRPLDIALLIAGIAIVGLIIYGGLNLGGNKSASTGASSSATVAAGSGSSANTGQTGAAPTAKSATRDITPLAGGQEAPAFTLPSADGKTISLADYKGKKVLLLEFMAPWCPHCQADAKFVNEVYEKYQGKDVEFLSINASPYGRKYEDGDKSPITMEDITWFRDKFGVKFPMLFDANIAMADAYHIGYFPTFYVVDKNGKITTQILAEKGNPITEERLSEAIDNALK